MIVQNPVPASVANPDTDRAGKKFSTIPNDAICDGCRHGFAAGVNSVVNTGHARQPLVPHADATGSQIIQHAADHGIRMATALDVHSVLGSMRNPAIKQHTVLGAI